LIASLVGPRASRLLGELVTWGLLGLVVAGATGFAWLTRHPDTPLVATAAEWPVVGAAARAFQARWLPPPGSVAIAAAADSGPGVTRLWLPVREVEVEDLFDLPPRQESPLAVPWATPFPVWDGDGPPPLGNDPAPPLPLAGRSADPARLAEACALFHGAPRESRLAGYRLLTDVEDAALLETVAAAAEQAEPLYVSRYGLSPVGETAETLVLYREEAAYRGLQDRSERIRGLASRGHVGWGMVALYAGSEADGAAVAPVLRHELAHLLNRRALGPALPPWLDEGIADDLAAFELDASLAPREVPLDAMRTVNGGWIERRGTLASLERLAAALASGGVAPLPSLLELEWSDFVAEPAAGVHYAASAWLVRYFLDDASGLRDGFRAFLRQVARGGGIGAGDLETTLGRSWPAIDRGWRKFVGERAAAAGVTPVVAPSGGPSNGGEPG
jgi:hypothetical protein